MKQKFELMASNKANYYTKGSPIQFVKMDLLREVSSREVAVCFSFKNVSQEPLQNLQIRFKCKDAQGEIVCDSTFCYEEMVAEPGEVFGGNEAVYLSTEPFSTIDVRLLSAENVEGELVSLEEYRRVRLPEQKPLSPEIAEALQASTNNPQLQYEPAVLQEGWQCACGAFHPGLEEGVYCDECGADRILVQNMITNLMRKLQGQTTQPMVDEDPTRMVVGKTMTYEQPQVDQQATQIVPTIKTADTAQNIEKKAVYRRLEEEEVQPYGEEQQYDDGDEEYDEYDELQEREERARMLIRWLPILTGLLCVLVVAAGVIWYQMVV